MELVVFPVQISIVKLFHYFLKNLFEELFLLQEQTIIKIRKEEGISFYWISDWRKIGD